MAHVDATAVSLKARFPVFSTVADSVIDGALAEARVRVDQSWPEAVYTQAQQLYAAHVLTLDGQGGGQEAQFAALNAAGVKSIKIASLGLTVSKGGESGSRNVSLLKQTSYGTRFYDMIRLYFPGAVVLNGAS